MKSICELPYFFLYAKTLFFLKNALKNQSEESSCSEEFATPRECQS